MKKYIKKSTLKLTVFLVGGGVLILTIFFLNQIRFFSISQNNNEKVPVENLEVSKKNDITMYYGSIPDLNSKFSCDYGILSTQAANVCELENYYRAYAERVYKMKKLQNVDVDLVNNNNYVGGIIEDNLALLYEWEKNFDPLRDSWCKSTYSFLRGSATIGNIASCKKEFEIDAIVDLNFIYYDQIVYQLVVNAGYKGLLDRRAYDIVLPSEIIKDFEPDNAHIETLVKELKIKCESNDIYDENC